MHVTKNPCEASKDSKQVVTVNNKGIHVTPATVASFKLPKQPGLQKATMRSIILWIALLGSLNMFANSSRQQTHLVVDKKKLQDLMNAFDTVFFPD